MNDAAADLPPAARRVQDALVAAGHPHRVRIMPASTRTSAEAAAAVGCAVAEIAKSLVFRARGSGQAVLAVASGAHRVDERKIAALIGEAIGKADADFVRARTGYAIGGVPPIAHDAKSIVVIDETLLRLERIWVAGGTPNALFDLSPAELVALTGGRVADIAQAA
jgi:prolyl-tRNA editing enzyme YbaK/EbsC (Cys-tRNA(Pro) deacylase)